MASAVLEGKVHRVWNLCVEQMLTAQEPQCEPKTHLNHFLHPVYFKGTDFVITNISYKFIRSGALWSEIQVFVEKVM